MHLRPFSWLRNVTHHQISTTAEQEIMLKRAAQISNQSLTDFVVHSACQAAELAIQDQRQFFVSGREHLRMRDLQDRTPMATDALRHLLSHKLPWEDASALQPPTPLLPEHAILQFESGKRSMDDWLAHRARQAQTRGLAKTFVVCVQQRVVGYFSLSVGQIDSSELPGRGNLSRDAFPIPVVILTRLAIDKLYQGKGLGSALLQEAMHRTLAISSQAGVEALLTQPLDEKAAQFYQSHGFVQSPAAYKQLLVMIKDLESVLG
jgi:uncharacterized protein (DUF1778 family)/GNAT superfamily N-acetyltransferase